MDLKESLRRYKDSARAGRVWIDYYGELHSYGGAASAIEILDNCTDPDALDVRLDQLLTQLRTKGLRPQRPFIKDTDSDGSYGNAVRALEG